MTSVSRTRFSTLLDTLMLSCEEARRKALSELRFQIYTSNIFDGRDDNLSAAADPIEPHPMIPTFTSTSRRRFRRRLSIVTPASNIGKLMKNFNMIIDDDW